MPRSDNLEMLAKVLGVPVTYFTYDDETGTVFYVNSNKGTVNNLREVRNKQGLTQIILAAKTGVPRRIIRAYEKSSSDVRITEEHLDILCDTLDATRSEILGESCTQEDYIKQCREAAMWYIECLNVDGLEKALERLRDMTDLPRYTRPRKQ